MGLLHLRIALCAALLFLAACRRSEPNNARVDAAIAPLIPGDTVVLAGLRLDRLKNTPFFNTYVQGRKIPFLVDMKAKTGIDPITDIWELVYAGTPNRSLLFIRGKFGGEFGLEPKFDVPGLQRMDYKGYYVLYQGSTGVLFMNSGVAIAGEIVDLRAVVDNRDRKNETPPLELIEMVKTLPPDHAWLVSRQAGAMLPKVREEGILGGFAKLAASQGRTTAHADLSTGVNLEFQGDYPNAEAARQVQDAVRAVIGLMRLRTPESRTQLMKIYDGVRVEARENRLTVLITAPFDLIDEFVKSRAATH